MSNEKCLECRRCIRLYKGLCKGLKKWSCQGCVRVSTAYPEKRLLKKVK